MYLAAPGDEDAQIEPTYNWDPETVHRRGRDFGHAAYEVDDIYATCQLLISAARNQPPPRDGRMAFVCSPDLISIELLQKAAALEPQEPWLSMPSIGTW